MPRFIMNPITGRLDAVEVDAVPHTDVGFLTGDSGGSVGPDGGHNINILGGPGIDVVGTPGTNTLTVSGNGGTEGTGQTIGAVTADLITFDLDSTAGVYIFRIDIAGFDSVTPQGAGYFMAGAFRTTGAAAVKIQSQVTDDFEEAGVIPNIVNLVASANNMIVRVTGTAGVTMDWRAVLTHTFRS